MVLLIACASSTETLRAVHLEVPVEGHVEVHAAWAGEGALRHPLKLLAQLEGPVDEEILLPEIDEDLVIYAWEDLDGDGVHCALGVDDELAGAVEVPFDFDVLAEPVLDTPCVGPERLYPPPNSM